MARYIGRNGPILHRFANEDVTLGAWLVGLEVTHVDERRFCCDSAERCMAQVRPLLCLCTAMAMITLKSPHMDSCELQQCRNCTHEARAATLIYITTNRLHVCRCMA